MDKKIKKKLIICYVNGIKDTFYDLEYEKNLFETKDVIEIFHNKKRIYIMKNNILKWYIQNES